MSKTSQVTSTGVERDTLEVPDSCPICYEDVDQEALNQGLLTYCKVIRVRNQGVRVRVRVRVKG
jgi:hypothetical protein